MQWQNWIERGAARRAHERARAKNADWQSAGQYLACTAPSDVQAQSEWSGPISMRISFADEAITHAAKEIANSGQMQMARWRGPLARGRAHPHQYAPLSLILSCLQVWPTCTLGVAPRPRNRPRLSESLLEPPKAQSRLKSSPLLKLPP